jgi:hypothetical protein
MFFNREGVAYFEYEKDILESDEEYSSRESSPNKEETKVHKKEKRTKGKSLN